MARAGYWNHNVHYQPVILRAVPPGCGAALEVGCGDGLLAALAQTARLARSPGRRRRRLPRRPAPPTLLGLCVRSVLLGPG